MLSAESCNRKTQKTRPPIVPEPVISMVKILVYLSSLFSMHESFPENHYHTMIIFYKIQRRGYHQS